MVTGPAAAAFFTGAFFAFLAGGAPSAGCDELAASPPAQEGERIESMREIGFGFGRRMANGAGAPAELRPGPASLRVKVLWSCGWVRGGGENVVWRVRVARQAARIVAAPAAP